MRRLRNSGTANSTKPPTNSRPWVSQRVVSTSVNSSWSIQRYLVHTSEALTSRAISATSAPIVIASGEIYPEPPWFDAGAGRGRGRGVWADQAERHTDKLR